MPAYPTPTLVRMATDRDGSTGVTFGNGVVIATLTLAQMQAINDDLASSTFTYTGTNPIGVAILFPEGRTFAGAFLVSNRASFPSAADIQYSLNTTNGIDGTWTNAFTGVAVATTVSPGYRTSILTLGVPVANVKGVRYTRASGSSTETVYAFHVYGIKTNSSDRLAMWHPTLDQPLTDFPGWFDWSDDPRGTTTVKSFRIKNLSAALTANTIVASCDSLNAESPTLASQTQFRYNAGAYGATATLSSLAPGAISQVFDVKLALTGSAALGLGSQRYVAAAGSWT